jgi:hypothetical protein
MNVLALVTPQDFKVGERTNLIDFVGEMFG